MATERNITAIVTPHPTRAFTIQPDLHGVASPLESAARAMLSIGRPVEAFTLGGAHEGGLITHRGFDGEVGALITALRKDLEDGRIDQIVAGPVSEPLARAAVALAPEKSCLWCGLAAKPSPKDAAMSGAIRQAKKLLYSSDVERRLLVEAFPGALNRAKIEAASTFGIGPRSYRTEPPPPQGAHPYLAYRGAPGRGPLRDWFTKLRDAFAFSRGPIDLYLFDQPSSGFDYGVGMRVIGPMSPAARARILSGALVVVDFNAGPEALINVFDAWRLGAPVIAGTGNFAVTAEIEAVGGGAVVADFDGFRAVVESYLDPERRQRVALSGRERAARRTDPDRFVAEFLSLLEP